MSKPFTFKQFSITQQYAPMKVGTDGVLLGAWCTCEDAKTALDIGTGTGLIALMLAQRNDAIRVTAIEPNDKAIQDAAPNFENSHWDERLLLHKADLESYIVDAPKFDLIVSNPPFFKNSLGAPDADRNMARHIDGFDPRAFAGAAVNCLSAKGVLAGIYPMAVFEEFDLAASALGLIPSRLCAVRATPEKPPHRMLFEYGFAERQTTLVEELIIEDKGRHNYSEAYKALTRDFYLSF